MGNTRLADGNLRFQPHELVQHMLLLDGDVQEDVGLGLAEHFQVVPCTPLGHGINAPQVLSVEVVLLSLQEASTSGRKSKHQILACLLDDLHLVVVTNFKKRIDIGLGHFVSVP